MQRWRQHARARTRPAHLLLLEVLLPSLDLLLGRIDSSQGDPGLDHFEPLNHEDYAHELALRLPSDIVDVQRGATTGNTTRWL